MIKRDTEGSHTLADKLFGDLNIFDLQGLLLTNKYEFSAALEAIYLTSNENLKEVEDFFTQDALRAKYKLATKLNIPLYIIVHQENNQYFTIFTMVENENTKIVIGKAENKTFKEFIDWWSQLKGTPQTKGFRHDAQNRTKNSIIDNLLKQNSLAWGGNVDGIIISKDVNSNIIGIVEKRIREAALAHYDPADFFYSSSDPMRNDHYTWKPLVKLALALDCPLYLLTFEKGNNTSYAYSDVKTIINGLQYWSGSPKHNITTEIEDFNQFLNQEKRLPIEKGYCLKCTKEVTDTVRDYCLNNRKRFKGKVYCFNHQKQI
ncbi:hypothetical protein ABEY65_29115 [Priestia aryabhattai]|uniref:hypothetical protein n=1 Tax=Priestia aryabhattai TaxID=412384 RepID=UPI003D28B69D